MAKMPLFKQLAGARTASTYAADKPTKQAGNQSKYDGADICFKCPYDDCIGGRKCPSNLRKKEKKS